jgi:Electron transfer DM13
MKKIIILSISLFILNACTKDQELTPVTQVVPPAVQLGTQESVGTFSGSGSYSASGTVKVVADKADAKKKYLSFENFKTSNGPDLYVYLAEDKTSKGFTSVVKLDKTGTFVLDVPTGANLTKQKFVLIWCQQFSVLFASAKLE